MTSVIIVEGSYGLLRVHAASGIILSGEKDVITVDTPTRLAGYRAEGIPDEYADILLFDTERWEAGALLDGYCDILGTAFVTDRGLYVREVPWIDAEEAWTEPFGLLPDYTK